MRAYIERPEHGGKKLVIASKTRSLYVEVENDWTALRAWRKHNWINVRLIDIGYEWKRYAGDYHEAWVRLIGFGLWLTLVRP